MAVSGQIGSYSFGEKPQVHSKNHPCIILDVALPNTLGQIAQGTVIGVDTDTIQNTLAKILLCSYLPRSGRSPQPRPS